MSLQLINKRKTKVPVENFLKFMCKVIVICRQRGRVVGAR